MLLPPLPWLFLPAISLFYGTLYLLALCSNTQMRQRKQMSLSMTNCAMRISMTLEKYLATSLAWLMASESSVFTGKCKGS